MKNSEALDFAKERSQKISYNLETLNKMPCRSYYQKCCEMLTQAIFALQEQAEREKECEYCKSNAFEAVGFSAFLDEKKVVLYGGNSRPDVEHQFKFCPKCGRRLK